MYYFLPQTVLLLVIPLAAAGYQFECTGTYHSSPVHVGESSPVVYEPDQGISDSGLSPPSLPVPSSPRFPIKYSGGYKLRKPKTHFSIYKK